MLGHGSAAEASSATLAAARENVRVELTWLLDRYEQALFSFLMVMLGHREAAQDCTQDTFLRAYENLSKGRPVTVQWLYKVARNRAVDELRRHQREFAGMDPTLQADTQERSDQAAAVQQALARLSPADREVLYLAEVDGFNSNEIAAMLGIQSGAVRMRLCRAHMRFRHAYGDDR